MKRLTVYLSAIDRRAAAPGWTRQSGFTSPDAPKTLNRSALLEFLEHGVRYAFPAERGEMTRSFPTAHAAAPLKSALREANDPPSVWPHVAGTTRGYALTPLYRHAPDAALDDPALYELLSLVDALRDGRTRERLLAMKELEARLDHA
jgi:hypothetical protein